MKINKALVIGYGSIGARHARILAELGCHTAVLSAREVDFPVRHAVLDAAISEQPDYVVIANQTARHHETLTALVERGYSGTVLVEKPIFDRCLALPMHRFSSAFVAYNLRFHPIIQRLRQLLQDEKIVSVQAYVGQYLPDWRPAVDYRQTYSASMEQGGGALRDLSHELDYLTWLLGGWLRITALGGQLSPLEVTSDDVFALMLVAPRCPVTTVQLNYLDRLTRRSILVNTHDHTFEADLIRGALTVDREVESFAIGRDDSYRAMHNAVLDGQPGLCTLDEGLETMRLIEAAETAARSRKWIER